MPDVETVPAEEPAGLHQQPSDRLQLQSGEMDGWMDGSLDLFTKRL